MKGTFWQTGEEAEEVNLNTWYICDGFVPSTEGRAAAITGHEAVAVINTGYEKAVLNVDVYFMDRPPMKGYSFEIQPERSHRIILGADYHLDGGMSIPVPSNTPYSMKLTSEGELHMQFTRVDSRSESLALFSTVVPKA